MTGRPDDVARPHRTCVGCRRTATKAELLRLVVVEGSVTPDPRGRLAGRGAWLHPDPDCLDRAERRRAFPRAFRLPGPLDLTLLRAAVEERADQVTNDVPAGSSAEPEASREAR